MCPASIPPLQKLKRPLRRLSRYAAYLYHKPLPSQRAAQDGPALARHSDIRLTMNTYSHVGQQEQAAAIGMLKGVGGSGVKT